MAILQYNEIKERKYITLDGEPYEVLSSHVSRKQARKPVNQTKLKHLISGRVIEKTFHSSDKAEEADMEKKKIVYIFNKGNEFMFHSEGNKGDRFPLSSETVGKPIQYFKQGDTLEAQVYNDTIIGIKYPMKVDLKVTEAMDAVKGNTAQGASKFVTVEGGVEISVPMFITDKDTIRVNTETGEYTDRLGSSFGK
jgi:elongation factor P